MDDFTELLLNAIEHIPIGVFILDPKGNYLYVNEEYCNTVHRTKEFLKNTSIPKFKELGYVTSNVWEQVMETRKPVTSMITIADERINGTYDTLTIGVPIFDADGNIQYIVYRQERIDTLIENLQLGTQNKQLFRSQLENSDIIDENLIFQSPQMKQIVSMLDVVSATDVSILVVGPSGTGKEVLAKHIHRASARNQGPLITINCAAIPESLLESELFGYVKGAFTGAAKDGKKGLIESAAGGTLFLDEINSMPLQLQKKLLRVLETKQITRLGSVESREVDFRLICASNEDLQLLVDQKLFRSDLFYRINVISVSIPPLNERKEDILPLALHFMNTYCKKYNRVKVLSEAAIGRLKRYNWPGNVRELRNTIERAVVMSPESELELSVIPIDHLQQDHIAEPEGVLISEFKSPDYDETLSLKEYIEQCEKKLFSDMLQKYKSVQKIEELLKLDRSNIYRRLKKYQLELPKT